MGLEQEHRAATMAVTPTGITTDLLRHMVQFALPIDATLAVAGDEDLSRFGLPRAIHFPRRAELRDAEDETLIGELEEVRSEEGIGFLVLPAASLSWIAGHPELETHIGRSCRLVLDEPEGGRIFALQEVVELDQNARRTLFELDGLPFPPAEMMRLTAGLFDFRGEDLARKFHTQGRFGAHWIAEALARRGRAMADFHTVLDFGCGCGRVLRQWRSVQGPEYHGSDLNEYLIRWASANLPFAQFAVNGYAPPLPYEDGAFDLVYSISVFTHLLEPLQREWAAEIGRVIAPGGLLIMTTHGPENVAELDQGARPFFEAAGGQKTFDAGELVVMRPEHAGTNSIAAFHPQRYVREVVAPAAGLEVVDYLPLGAIDAHQDVYILEKPRRPVPPSRSGGRSSWPPPLARGRWRRRLGTRPSAGPSSRSRSSRAGPAPPAGGAG